MSESIGRGRTVILVYGNELEKCHDAPFYKYLYENYSNVSNKGINKYAPWVYVNIESKRFFPAIPGFKITDCLNNHAVTIKEFYKILEQYEHDKNNFENSEKVKKIYSNYEGKDVFVFREKRFDCDDGAKKEKQLERKLEIQSKNLIARTLYFIDLSHRKIKEEENKFIIPKTIEEKEFLPVGGRYLSLLHQQGVPGEEYLEYMVQFTDDEIIFKNDGKTNGADLFWDLRIYRKTKYSDSSYEPKTIFEFQEDITSMDEDYKNKIIITDWGELRIFQSSTYKYEPTSTEKIVFAESAFFNDVKQMFEKNEDFIRNLPNKGWSKEWSPYKIKIMDKKFELSHIDSDSGVAALLIGIRILIDAHYKNLVDWKNFYWGLDKLYDEVMELAEKTKNE